MTLDLGRLLMALRRRIWLVAGVALIGAGLGYYQARSQPSSFQARAVVQLVDARQALTGGLVNPSKESPYQWSLASQSEILQSRAVASAAADSETIGVRVHAVEFSTSLLRDVAIDSSVSSAQIPIAFLPEGYAVGGGRAVAYGVATSHSGVRFTIARQPPNASTGTVMVLPRELAIDMVAARVNATPRKQTNIIDITYTADDPETAARMVNRVALSYQAVNARLAQQQWRRRREFIQEQLARTDVQLADAERALNEFRGRQQAYSAEQKFAARQASLGALDQRREELDAERRVARMLLRGLQSGDTAARREAAQMLGNSPGLGQNPVTTTIYQQIMQYERTRAELTKGPQGSAPTNPGVLRLDTLLAEASRQLTSAVQAHISMLDARIESLDQMRASNARALQELPAAEAQGTRLAQNAQSLRDQGASLRSEYQQARIAEAAEVGQVDIVELASRARLLGGAGNRLLLFGLFLGILLGVGSALGLEALDRSVKRREDVERALGAPVLATVPRIDFSPKTPPPLLTRLRPGRRSAQDAARRRQVALTAATHARSPGAEAHRQLRATIFQSRGGELPRRVLITSAVEGEGKTSIAVNLAAGLAQQRLRVLLIDCDLHGPKLHRIFQRSPNPGLSEVLLTDALPREVIRQTAIPGLFLMTAGSPPEGTSDPLGSPRLRAMLNDVVHDFDVVILDSSPALALADSAVLASLVRTVLVVVRAGKTSPAELSETARQFVAVGADLVGAVLNDPDGRVPQYGGYAYGYPRG